jgi:formiminotetrahydrofolate cyclodeaminase
MHLQNIYKLIILVLDVFSASHNTNFASGLNAAALRTTINLAEVSDSAKRHSLRTHISNAGSAPVFKYKKERGHQLR